MTMTTDETLPPTLSGTRAIARALGMSERSVFRLIEAGRLNVFKLGPATSPWRCPRSEIKRIKGGRV